jgi:hypothetical protein
MVWHQVQPVVDSFQQLPSLIHGEGTATSVKWIVRVQAQDQIKGHSRGWHICLHTLVFSENHPIINLIDEYKNHSSAVQWGWMNITSNESILAALENQASHYSNRGTTCGINDNIIQWALDTTGTVDTSFLCNSNEDTKQIALVGQ